MPRRFQTPMRVAIVALLFAAGAFAEDYYLVNLRGDVDGIAKRHGLRVVQALTGSAAGNYVLSSTGAVPDTVLHRLSMESAVQSAEVDQTVRLPGVAASAAVYPASAPATGIQLSSSLVTYFNSNASSAYVNQPAADVIGLSGAQQMATGRAALVATIDTGVDFGHSVLQNSLTPGYDFVHNTPGGQELADLNQETTPILDQETTPILDGGTAIVLQQETTPILDQETTPILDGTLYPAFGHGTMVAGLIHLVAPSATIMPLRAFGADGSASISQIVSAISYAIANQVNVINMSFSVPVDSPALAAALEAAVDAGIICVASAGNNGLSTSQVWPAAYGYVIGVAGTNNSGLISTWSNYGQVATLAAPDEGLITTYPMQHYAQVSGTSFSAPLVSGGAALLMELNHRITQSQTEEVLEKSAANLAPPLGPQAGELNLNQACLTLKRRGD